MKDFRGQIIIGVILIYLGVRALISGPLDNEITSILAPYFMIPVGFVSLITGAIRFLQNNLRSLKKNIAQILSWMIFPIGIMILLFEWLGKTIRGKNIILLLTNGKYLLIGIALVVIGYLFRSYSLKIENH